MDKNIVEILYKNGYLTAPVNADLYKDINELIEKGFITIPGAKNKIMELLSNMNVETITSDEDIEDTKTTLPDTVVEVKEDEIVEVTEVDETEAPAEEIVDAVKVVEETPVEEVVTEEVPAEEVAETTEEVPVEEAPKKKKSTKKTE